MKCTVKAKLLLILVFRPETIQSLESKFEFEARKNQELTKDIIHSNENLKLTAFDIFQEVSRLR